MHASFRLLLVLMLSAVMPVAVPRPADAQERAPSGEPPESVENEPLLRLLPSGAETVTFVPDVTELMRAFLQTPFHSIYGDPRYRTFLGPLVELLEIENPELGDRVRRPNAMPRVMLSGALIAAEYPALRESGGRTPRVAIYEVQPGNGEAFLEVLLASSKAPGVRVNRATDPVAGRAVVALQHYRKVEETIEVRGDARKYRREIMEERGLDRYEPDFAPIATRREMSEELFFAGEDFVVRCVGGRRLLGAVLERIGADEDRPGLATQFKWTDPRSSMRSTPHALYYRDLRPDGRRGRKKFDDEERRLGLHEIRSLVGGLRLREDRLAIEVAVYVPAPRTGVGKLLFINEPNTQAQFEREGFLPVEGYARDVSDLIPADAVAYSAFSADMAELWTEAYRILKRGAPEIADLLDIYFQTQNRRGDFASLFASTFGSRWLTFSRFPEREDSRWPAEPEMTAMLEIRDAEALAPVLDHWLQNLSQLLNLEIEKFTVSGRQYFKLQGAESLDPRLTPLGPIAYICLAERWLILSVRQEHILTALARLQSRSEPGSAVPDAPLMQEAGYRKLRASLPSERFFEAYALPSATRHVMISPIMLLLGEGLDDASSALIDLKQAPRERVWREAFGTMGVALRSADPTVIADFELMYRDASD